MELRLLITVLRVLDPRAWRRRAAQIGGGLFAAVWVWVRAVRAIDGVRQRRDAHQDAREQAIVARLRRVEHRRIEESIDSLS